MEARLLAYIGIVTVIALTPGPDMALVTRVVFGRGRVAGWISTLGVCSGHFIWGTASALGIAALLKASATLYTILRFAGALYLVWLGVQALRSRAAVHEQAEEIQPKVNKGGSFRQGLVSNLLNPKIGAFYTTLLPQFIAPGQPVFLTSLLLTTIFVLIGLTWLTFYVLILARAGAFFRRPSVRQTMERVTGVVLIGLGIRLAVEQR